MEQLPDYENMTCEELVKTIVDMQASAKYNREIFDELFDYLLFAYSPENAAKVVQENASILKDEELRFFVLKKAHGAYQAEIFLEALNMLAFLVDNEVALVKEGALSLCIRAMATDATNARTQSLGCKVIANLAGCVQVRNFLGRTAIPIVLQALKNQKKYVEVVKSSLGALANLCYHSASNKKIFCANQGIDRVLDALKEHAKSASCASVGLALLRSVSSTKDLAEIHCHAVARLASSLMAQNTAVNVVQEHGLWVLVVLLAGNKCEMKQYLCANDMLPIVLKSLQAHTGNERVQHAGWTLCALLARLEAFRGALAPFGPLLLKTVAEFPSSSVVSRAAMKVIYRLSFSKTFRVDLGETNVVSDIVKVMKRQQTTPTVQRIAMLCLARLSLSQSNKQKASTLAMPQIMQATTDFQLNTSVSTVAVLARNKILSIGSYDDIDPQDKLKDSSALLLEVGSLRKELQGRVKQISTLQKNLDQVKGESTQFQHRLREKEALINNLLKERYEGESHDARKPATAKLGEKLKESSKETRRKSASDKATSDKEEKKDEKSEAEAKGLSEKKKLVLEQLKEAKKVNPGDPEGTEKKLPTIPFVHSSPSASASSTPPSSLGQIKSNTFTVNGMDNLKKTVIVKNQTLREILALICTTRAQKFENFTCYPMNSTQPLPLTDLDLPLTDLKYHEIEFLETEHAASYFQSKGLAESSHKNEWFTVTSDKPKDKEKKDKKEKSEKKEKIAEHSSKGHLLRPKSILDRRKELREEKEREVSDDQNARQISLLLAKLEEQNALLEEYKKNNEDQERQINSLKFDLANTRESLSALNKQIHALDNLASPRRAPPKLVRTGSGIRKDIDVKLNATM